MGFNIAAVFFFFIWGMVRLCKKDDAKENENLSGTNKSTFSAPQNSQRMSRPIISILKPCGGSNESDENENGSDINEEDYSGFREYQPDQVYGKRARFAEEPFLVRK